MELLYNIPNKLKERRSSMKKTATIVISMLAVVVLAMTALVGCGGGTPDSLAGTSWKVSTINYNGVDMNVDDYLKMAGMSGEMVFVFSESTVDAQVNGESMGTSASYTYKDGVITIDGQDGKVEGNNMSFEMDGVSLKLVKK